MLISYFDSSLLLSILLNEERASEASVIWKYNPIRVSSILLKFETNITLMRRYEQFKNNVSRDWLETKLLELNSFFKEIFFADINNNFEKSVSTYYRKLSKCKSLDAIHLATALDISEKYGKSEIRICSFDKNMLKVAKQLGFETNLH
jgi:predicted nucleic acid-binding protein